MAASSSKVPNRIMVTFGALLVIFFWLIVISVLIAPPSGKSTLASKRPAVPVGMARIDGRAIGCTSREAFSKVFGLLVVGDNVAFQRSFQAYASHGACRIFAHGEHVYIAETALFSGLAAVRPPGELRAYWTNIERVKGNGRSM